MRSSSLNRSVTYGDYLRAASCASMLFTFVQYAAAGMGWFGSAPSHQPLRASVYLLRAGIAFLLALLRPRVPIPAEVAS